MTYFEPWSGLEETAGRKETGRNRTIMLKTDWFNQEKTPILLPGFIATNTTGKIVEHYFFKMRMRGGTRHTWSCIPEGG
jgi:hypothetical protein